MPFPNKDTCYVCKKGNKIVTDPQSAEIICSNCGVVISDKVEDTSHSERFVSSQVQIDHTRVRTRIPISLECHNVGFTTIIAKDDRDASGHKIDAAVHTTMQRLRTWDFRVQLSTSSNRNLKTAFNLLNTLKDKLGLSYAVTENTAYLYRKAQQRQFSRGRSIASVICAAIYIACRDLSVPKTMKDIAQSSNLTLKNIARTYRQLMLEFDYKVPNVDPVKCLAKVANRTNLTEKTKRHALSILEKIVKNEISAGKDPMGLAATVLYISSIRTGENISQKQISYVAGITDVTLRNRFKDIKNQLSELSELN
ncbi:MAG TPA: transcription initiation factor IIB [Nitrososphaeraceae archaeon]|nr:transcription initiation factor IIB [Nitrososphaeraceae archaeon]